MSLIHVCKSLLLNFKQLSRSLSIHPCPICVQLRTSTEGRPYIGPWKTQNQSSPYK